MKLKSLLIICFSIAMLGLADYANAQSRKYKRRKQTSRRVSSYRGGVRGVGRFEPYLFVGASVNAGNYFGDLAPVNKAASTDISFTRPGFGLYGGYRFHHSLALRAGLNWVRVSGDDFSADPNEPESFSRYARNLSFRNDIKEFQVGLEIYLFPNYGGPNNRLPLNAYLFVGGAIFHHQPMGKVPDFDYQGEGLASTTPPPQAGEWVKLRPLGTEGQNLGFTPSYSNIELSIPVSVGVQMRLPGTQLNAGLEFGIRYMFTDYIDDVSGVYVDYQLFDDELARIMADRSAEATNFQGNSRNNPNLDLVQLGSAGNEYFTSGDVGGGITNSIRGNPDDDDLIFMTQLKLTYIVGGTRRRRAKYR